MPSLRVYLQHIALGLGGIFAGTRVASSLSPQDSACDVCDLADVKDLAALARDGMGVVCDISCKDGENVLLCNALGLVSSTAFDNLSSE